MAALSTDLGGGGVHAVRGRDGEGVVMLLLVIQTAGQAHQARVHAHAEPAALVALCP